jgi:hypothetical protein
VVLLIAYVARPNFLKSVSGEFPTGRNPDSPVPWRAPPSRFSTFDSLLIVDPGDHGVIVQWHDGPVDDEQASFQAHRILRAVPKRFDLINVFQVLDPPD